MRSRAADDDPYDVLGISRAAGAAEIRRAYRLLALRHHPDRAGPEATAVFQRIALAYRMLSSPEARAAYDARVRRSAAAAPGGGPVTVSAAEAAARRRGVGGPLLERLSATLEALVASAAARLAEGGLVELLLTVAEARHGGTAAITLPWQVSCPTCGGCASPGDIWCVRCEFAGTVNEEVTVCIAIPPFVVDGTTFTVAVDAAESVPPLRIRVRV